MFFILFSLFAFFLGLCYNVREVMFMRAVIISGGKIDDYNYIREQIAAFRGDVIICADSGYNHAVKMGLTPDLVVGDFDSSEAPEGVEFIKYPAEKDQTDTEIALIRAREMRAREFLFVGVTGTRADHTLTNIFLLHDCLSRGESAEIIDEHNSIKMTNSSLEIKGKKGDLVSLVPVQNCAGVYTENLAYPLENAELKFSESRGVSNVMLGETAGVRLAEGLMLVIKVRD
jgi:thiamine pyrophosphokinase